MGIIGLLILIPLVAAVLCLLAPGRRVREAVVPTSVSDPLASCDAPIVMPTSRCPAGLLRTRFLSRPTFYRRACPFARCFARLPTNNGNVGRVTAPTHYNWLTRDIT